MSGSAKFETLQGRNGHQIVTVEGRHLCSMVDPVTEADRWVQRQSDLADGAECLVVLGLGCGYHVNSLRKRYPSHIIFVVEAREELIDFSRKHHGLELAGVEFVHLDIGSEIKNTSWLRKIADSHFVILRHRASYSEGLELYQRVEQLLVGRDTESLKWLFNHNSYWKNLKDKKLLGESLRVARPLDINDIAKITEDFPSVQERQKLIVRALNELIK